MTAYSHHYYRPSRSTTDNITAADSPYDALIHITARTTAPEVPVYLPESKRHQKLDKRSERAIWRAEAMRHR